LTKKSLAIALAIYNNGGSFPFSLSGTTFHCYHSYPTGASSPITASPTLLSNDFKLIFWIKN